MNLKKKIKLLPVEIISVIAKATDIADKMGISIYIVGGFVRDLLLGPSLKGTGKTPPLKVLGGSIPMDKAYPFGLGVPNLDVDIVVKNNGIAFAEKLAKTLSAHLIVHKRFATAVLTLAGELKVDVATARKEVYREPAALPTVSPGNIYDDLLRRDFSINAMAIAINKNNFGELIDYFNGKDDLAKKKIRIMHALSFVDDPTRMLRARRFAERYGFKLEIKTRQAFNKAKKDKMLDKVNKHRTRDEFMLCLKEARPLALIKGINKSYGFSFIHPKLKLNKRKLKFIKNLDRMIKYFNIQYPKKRALDSWVIFLTALLQDLEPELVKKICLDYAFRKGDVRRILSYCCEHKKAIGRLKRKAIKPSSVYQILDPLSFEVIVMIMAEEESVKIRKIINDFLISHNGIRLAISGSDLKRLGFAPGPHFKKMLTDTLHAKIDKVIKDKEGEIDFIKRHRRRHIEPFF